MKTLVPLLISAMMACAPAAQAEVFEIDQIMDMTALTPEDFYRFEPNYYWIKPGDSVRFINTTGNHTVKSIAGVWPDGVAPVDISNQDKTELRLDVPGVYGFRCKVHARHGMFALVVVGSPESNVDKISFDKLNERGRLVFGQLYEKMQADWASR